jgi:hypothetical protein
MTRLPSEFSVGWCGDTYEALISFYLHVALQGIQGRSACFPVFTFLLNEDQKMTGQILDSSKITVIPILSLFWMLLRAKIGSDIDCRWSDA